MRPSRAQHRRRVRLVANMAAAAVILAACAGTTEIASPAEAADYDVTGNASWYGARYHGRLTASGQRYDMNAMTAAHRTLPFGTKVRVVNLSNRRAVVVTINDRGPYAGRRVIDVSRRAAEILGMVDDGVVRVRVHTLARR